MVQINIQIENNKNNKYLSRSILSKAFRGLIRINMIPLKWDRSNNQLSFKYVSKAFAVYYLYFVVLTIFGFICYFMFGFSRWMEFWKNGWNCGRMDGIFLCQRLAGGGCTIRGGFGKSYSNPLT